MSVPNTKTQSSQSTQTAQTTQPQIVPKLTQSAFATCCLPICRIQNTEELPLVYCDCGCCAGCCCVVGWGPTVAAGIVGGVVGGVGLGCAGVGGIGSAGGACAALTCGVLCASFAAYKSSLCCGPADKCGIKTFQLTQTD